MNLKRIIFFLGTICVSFLTEAQNLSQHNWYFGNTANAIRFNRSTNKASLIGGKFIPFGTGGSAVATNASNADLLFYTDGQNIYDASNVLMDQANALTNGAGLSGNTSANQPAVICPVPEDSTKYLVFANSANYTTGGTIKVSVVDMIAGGNASSPAPPLGNVLKKNLNTGIAATASEGMIIIPHSNGKDYWLITHQNSSNSFTASQISKTSFNNAGAGSFTFSLATTSTILSIPSMSVANFSYNSKVKKLAVSAQDTNTDAVILKFDDSNGALTYDRTIYNTGYSTVAGSTQAIYDIQWDNAGQYLYISRNGDSGTSAEVLQYDYVNSNASGSPTILTSILKTTEYRSWGLQLAPDSAIYHLYETAGGQFLIKKFTKTDTIASSVIETVSPFGPIDFKGRQFPSFSPRARTILKLSFTPLTACQNNNTTFFPTVIPTADSLHWDFVDTIVTAWSPVHKFKNSGIVPVKLTAYYQGDSTFITLPVNVNAFDLTLTLPTDTTACRPEFPTTYGTRARFSTSFHVPLRASGSTAGTVTYTWSDGETGKTLWPVKPGYYYVNSSTDANGCAAHAGVNVKEYQLQDSRANIWYFGNNAGIDFNPMFATPPGPAVPLSGSNMDAPAGCSIVCDRNGQVLFYTDGNQVYDRTKTSIASGIGGDPISSQSALIVPVPGDETLYYIFTTQTVQLFGSNNELRYSLFDLKLNNGNGGIAPGQKDVLLFSKSTERITASTNWLIAHEWGNNTFRAYKITPGGLSDPVYSAIGSDHSFAISENAEGYMKLGPAPANTLAVALASPGTNLVELFHLNDSTGVLSNYRKLVLSNTAGQVYGVEFSAGGSKVFASVSGASSSDIYEYSIDSVGHTKFLNDAKFSVEIGALEIGPDGKIYVAINNSAKLGTINPDEAINTVSTIDMATGFALAGGTNSRMGLPNFIQHVGNGPSSPGFSWAGTCLGTPTVFTGSPTDPTIDKYTWSFGDGGGDNILSPTHTYGAANTYLVIFQIDNRCLVELNLPSIVTKHNVLINPTPGPPSLPVPSPFICTTAVTLDANKSNTTGLSYLWSTGETTQQISVSTSMSVSVTNTDKNGCSSTATTFVGDGRPQVNLGPDQTVCQNGSVISLDAQNAGDTYVWSIKNLTTSVVTPGGTSEFQGVNTASPGRFMYSVVVTDPVTSCKANAQTIFTVNQAPIFSFTGTDLTNCTTTDGTLTLSGISSSHLYSYSIIGPSTIIGPVFDQNVAAQPVVTGRQAGTYSAIISDQVSGCNAFKTVALSNATFTVFPSAALQCDPPSITITTTATGPWTYLITNTTTGATTPVTPPSPSFSSSPQIVQVVGSQGQGVTISYNVEVKDNAGCIKSAPVSVSTKTTTPLHFKFDPCAGTLTEDSGGGATNYSWSGTGVPSPPGDRNWVPLTVGTNTYQVDAQSNLCPVTLSTTYKFDGKITPDFTFKPCIDTVKLVATTVASNYLYRWYDAGLLIAQGQKAFITLAPYHKTIELQIVDSNNGCTTTPGTSHDVQVFGAVDVTVSSDAKCDDGKLFTLSTTTTNAPSPTYAWFLNGATISGASSATLKQTSNGLYKVRITQGVCKDSASVLVFQKALPVGKLKQQYQICNDPDNHDPSSQTATLDPGAFLFYNWYKNGTLQSEVSQVYIASEVAKYKVNITDDFGCSNYDSTRVILNCEPVIAGPNAFRPASVHADDTYFQLFTFFIDNFEIIVFNRWGEAVFESKDQKFHWNGGYNNNPGQPLPGGTYTYVVRYFSRYHPDEGVQELRGGVVLLR